jgi:hypothetical protein
VNPFDASVQHQVGKLIDRPENGFQIIFFLIKQLSLGFERLQENKGMFNYVQKSKEAVT